ncbi:MAG TPA: histidine--tRNA ligase [Bacteroidales bacterium]|nr:histidine--tRNA ligase [Bacteroidales bacterium]
MASNLTIPKGTRDFGPVEMTRRNYIFDTVRKVFRLYGYLPLETPAMENLTTLLGKYGEEGDKLLFRVLNSGDYLSSVPQSDLLKADSQRIAGKIAEKGLKYDLTVPFARYVVQNRNNITFPFKRFQIQPVWRADKPQKGRYREFYQCDVDVIGSDSLYNEYELVQIIDEVFSRLNIRNTIRISNRKILIGIAEIIGEGDRITDVSTGIDKLEKIGIVKVNEELSSKGISPVAIRNLHPILLLKGDTFGKLQQLETILAGSETGLRGIAEMRTLFNYLKNDTIESDIQLDLTLARGLEYYTGAIIEVKSLDYEIGSICGGGRYDDLTGIFGLPGVSGVGVSFGADRIYDVLKQLDLFPDRINSDVMVMFVNFGEAEARFADNILKQLRKAGFSSELYPDNVKMKRQMSYANSQNIPYVALAGEDEMQRGIITLKDMKSGNQMQMKSEELLSFLDSHPD